ncbi:MAG: hypothetical protein WDA71_14290, partial [Actinomycetota bacterium]
MSLFGRWSQEQGLPVFVYEADHEVMPEAEWDPIVEPKTRRHWLVIGNRRIFAVVANDGTVGILDEHDGLRWLTAPDPEGTGISIIEEPSGFRWASSFARRPPGQVRKRTFGPTWFSVSAEHEGLALERTLLCPEGEQPWVLVRVRLAAKDGRARSVRHIEEWALRPRFLNVFGNRDFRREAAKASVRYPVKAGPGFVRAREERTEQAARFEQMSLRQCLGPLFEFMVGGLGTPELKEAAERATVPQVFGDPTVVLLDALGVTSAQGSAGEGDHPVLRLTTDLDVPSKGHAELWFRFGIDDGSEIVDPAELYERSIEHLRARLPKARCAKAPAAEREVPWHAAILTGGSCADGLLGGHTLNQGSAYMYCAGGNAAARDPLQHALPLVYSEPDLALSVLRNTCSWATPQGDLPYALDGAKRPDSTLFQPSDQSLWAFWLAAEYAAATGDLAAFDADVCYHPIYGAPAAPLREHLRRQFRFFVDEVGLGEGGHVRVRGCDWNDMVIVDSGAARSAMIERGSSVLNSAMAAWVLPVFAGLCDRLGESKQAAEARTLATDLRRKVAGEWNGRWFRRAYAPGGNPIGEEDIWLEVQPWAILCGAADEERARALITTIDEILRAGSPLGARLRWPIPKLGPSGLGDATYGGIWFAISMTLVWAAARVDRALGWDEWSRMTLTAHSQAYPAIWEGTLSGPDCFNAPESERPGRTWA